MCSTISRVDRVALIITEWRLGKGFISMWPVLVFAGKSLIKRHKGAPKWVSVSRRSRLFEEFLPRQPIMSPQSLLLSGNAASRSSRALMSVMPLAMWETSESSGHAKVLECSGTHFFTRFQHVLPAIPCHSQPHTFAPSHTLSHAP